MATLDDRLKDAEYINWVKDSLCLGYAKDGLETFANQSSTRLHQHVTNKLGNNPSANALCNKARVIYNKTAKKWGMSCCINCGQYVDELVKFAGFNPTQDNWNNASVQLWPQEPWEMAKVYMNANQKGAHKTPKDTDLSGVLNFIDHCMIARGDIIDVQNIQKVKKEPALESLVIVANALAGLCRLCNPHIRRAYICENHMLAHTLEILTCLILYILMNLPIYIDKMSMGLPRPIKTRNCVYKTLCPKP